MQDIKSHPVFVFMKGVPEQPQCGFSMRVCRILDAVGVEYGARNVLADDSIREGIKKFTYAAAQMHVRRLGYSNACSVGCCA